MSDDLTTTEERENSAGPEEEAVQSSAHGMDFLYDVPMSVSVELGRTEIQLRDLLQIGTGAVLELNKLAGEPLEVFVNDRLVSKGEVVVVNEKYGIRLTDIIDPINTGAETRPTK